VSEAIRKQVRNFPFVKNKIIVIPLGIAPVSLFEKEETQKKIFGNAVEAGTLSIGSIGELHPVKGHIYAIEAIAGLILKGKKIKYAVIGEGAYRPILEKKIADL